MGTRPSLIQHGGWPFLLTSIVGRLPPAMIQLGLLMYVTSLGLGLGLGGLNVAAVGLGTAIGAPLMGRLVDALGPLPVVVGATVLQVGGLFIIHTLTPGLVAGETPATLMLLVAAVCGFANPQIGPITRSHWSHLSRDRREPALIGHALGYEGAVDEMSFIVGPIVASLLVSTLGPTPAIFVLMVAIVVGQGVFAAYLWVDREAWKHRTLGAAAASGRIPFGALVAPMAVLLAVGITFGSTQTALTAVNEARGTPALTGIIYGTVGIGSAISSIVTTRLPARIGASRRLLGGAVVLLVSGIGFAFLPGAGALLGLAFFLGLGVGVILVTGFARAEAIAPSTRIASVMTMLSMCLTLGVSIGAASTGQLADTLWLGFLPVIIAGAMALAAAVLIAVSRRRSR
jgi:MFS family permease